MRDFNFSSENGTDLGSKQFIAQSFVNQTKCVACVLRARHGAEHKGLAAPHGAKPPSGGPLCTQGVPSQQNPSPDV